MSKQRLYVVRLRQALRFWRSVALAVTGIAVVLLVLLIIKCCKVPQVTESVTIQSQESSPDACVAETTIFVTESAEPETESCGMYPEFTYSKDWDTDDAYLLAKIAMAEAEGESIQDKTLVILVVLNRVWSADFPDSIHDVIFQENQFEPITNGRWDNVEPDADAWEAVYIVETARYDYSGGALYFESVDSDSTWHSRNLEFLYQVGNHKFYK